MTRSTEDEAADRLAREPGGTTGEGRTDGVLAAPRERPDGQRGRRVPTVAERLGGLGREAAALPVLDVRPAEELVGYDERGLPA